MPKSSPSDLVTVARAVARGDSVVALKKIARTAELVRGSFEDEPFFLDDIKHQVYAGDTLLHVAAAAYDIAVARALVHAGANIAARNRRGAQPIHYASDGSPTFEIWDPDAQATMIAYLIATGADPNAVDKSGVSPLHRAVRTRCTGAVRALLRGGANRNERNKSGSLPRDLAEHTTGRGGAGSPESRKEQRAIVALLNERS